MDSPSKRFSMVFNGEIYNFGILKNELVSLGYSFRGGSDTEVILAAFEAWGIHKTIVRLNGMFVIAVWDRDSKSLTLIRDRLGIKPLYVATTPEGVVFASEPQALFAVPSVKKTIHRGALTLFFRYGFIPAPHSIYEDTQKLDAGHLLTVQQQGGRVVLSEQSAYWSARSIWEKGALTPLHMNDNEAIETLESTLLEAVSKRMIADVPLGAFLSGGIDSSLVAALMQRSSTSPIQTFSIGFKDPNFNEAHHAAAVAKHLGTAHTELYVSIKDLESVVPQLSSIWTEPFSDASQIPTYLLSKMTRERVTVALSGDGGDELFSGYSRYNTTRQWKALNRFPAGLRRLASSPLRRVLQRVQKPGIAKNAWRARALSTPDFAHWFEFISSHHKQPNHLVLGSSEPYTKLTAPQNAGDLGDLERQMSYWDLVQYLPDDILTKVDRASMAVSLEARVPLLDHHVVELAARLPTHQKIRGQERKWILKQVLYRHVPKALLDRPKRGFGVPIGDWLRGPLRPWAESLLDPQKIEQAGILNGQEVENMWKGVVSNRGNWDAYIWDVLMFQAWFMRQ